MQQHVVHLFAQGQAPVRWLADLHNFADKSAKVLATSLNATLRHLCKPVGCALEKLWHLGETLVDSLPRQGRRRHE